MLDFKGRDATLTLVDPTGKPRALVKGSTRPLDADFSAPLACYPQRSEFWNGQMWRNVINEVEKDPVLRGRCQCWVFGYPAGNPPAYPAPRFREELALRRILRLHLGQASR